MNFSQLKRRYKNYKIVLFGFGFASVPYTGLPKHLSGLKGKAFEKELGKTEVKGFEVAKSKPFTEKRLAVMGLKAEEKRYRGEIYAIPR